ncbi:Imm32 family immunity protein [Streptomyces sp. SD11]|uniref:Imm32 family immunity protein n=1 Tax=Streptomyces sp. SD11 TaxID=3452209 RepID=UPI003F8BCB80
MTFTDATIRYAAATSEVDIAGSAAALEELGNALLQDGAEVVTSVGSDPSPYTSYLSGIRVELREDRVVLMTVDEGQKVLTFTGSEESMTVLADNIRGLGREGDPGEHQHIEHHEGHCYLAESPVSLVVSRKGR